MATFRTSGHKAQARQPSTKHTGPGGKPCVYKKKTKYQLQISRWYHCNVLPSSSHVWMWELDHKVSWVRKNGCFWIVILERTFESPCYNKIKPVTSKGNQLWIFTGRTDAEAEAPILWPPDAKSRHWKRPWCWEGLKTKGKGGSREWNG